MPTTRLILGDCVERLRELADCSVDAVVTDPPYGLSFMGKKWDYDVPSVEVWAECLRVLKPGGHLLAFAGTRTQHRMAVRIEDAGFEIRDMIAWVYGSGFPKSLDVSKAIDRAAGVEREKTTPRGPIGTNKTRVEQGHRPNEVAQSWNDTGPATDAARQWSGWGTALKPALEPITVARKPLEGTVAANVLEHGTGALNVDGCRVEGEPWKAHKATGLGSVKFFTEGENPVIEKEPNALGRWPANLIHDGSEEVVGCFPVTGPSSSKADYEPSSSMPTVNFVSGSVLRKRSGGYDEPAGTAARFFYCAKASKDDRDDGCEGLEERAAPKNGSGLGRECSLQSRQDENGDDAIRRRNHHPTVKPTALMRYLCRLVTPPGGTVLDPFMGSGSTGKAAALEGFGFVGIEREEEYLEIAKARIGAADPLFQLTASV